MTEQYYKVGKHEYMRYEDDSFAEFVIRQIPFEHLAGINDAVELGAGMGRFSGPLVNKFQSLTLVEPCESFAQLLRQTYVSDSVTVLQTTAADALASLTLSPRVIFAFHLLHHINRAERLRIHQFVATSQSVGVVVEPNPLNPLLILQILTNPDMSFWEERRYLYLTLSRHAREITSCGCEILHSTRICLLPPFLINKLLKNKTCEQLSKLENFKKFLPWLCSYQVIIYKHA